MEIRSATITYSKNKSKSIRNREQKLIRKLDHLDGAICNNFSFRHVREFKQIATAGADTAAGSKFPPKCDTAHARRLLPAVARNLTT